ncbi:glycosyltransferase [Iamia sp. SCSIO 61187]|nr:glycosyltransferase [Iamia sp. SCSIO 61187]
MDDRPRTYLFALVDGGGTVPPELGAVRRLVERGHAVTVLGEDSMRRDVEATGARYRPWVRATNRASRHRDDDPWQDWECKNPNQLFERILERQLVGPAPAFAADTDDALAEVRPDLVVCSMFAFGAMVAAEAAGVPFDILIPNAYALPAPGMPPFGAGLRPARGRVGELRDLILHSMLDRAWRKGLPGLNALRQERGLDPLDRLFAQADPARRHLVLTSAAFDFPARLPDQVRYVGPVLDDPTWAEGAWSPPPGDDPLVLVALSTTFQDQVPTLQRIVDGLARMPVRVLVTTGPALDPGTLVAPANVTVVAAAPHSVVLEHAAAVVTHGGHGTVVRALAAGVPMLVLPHGRDQSDNAVRVTTRGAGLKLERKASPAKVARAVRRLLDDPSFRIASERLGASIRRDAASGALVVELESVPVRR